MALVELKREYTSLLAGYISTPIYQGLVSIYQAAAKHKEESGTTVDELRIFQDLLKNVVPKWSPNVLEKEVRRIRAVSKMGSTLDKIFTAIIKSTVMILAAVHRTDDLHHVPKESYQAPVFEAYIHRCYVLCARQFFNYPFLFSNKGDPRILKDNQREALCIIKECVHDAIGHSLPLQELLSEFIIDETTTAPIHHQVVPFNNTVSLLADDGTNVMDKVFSTYNIREVEEEEQRGGHGGAAASRDAVHMPPIMEEDVSKHTITNFLLDDPRIVQSDSIVQSHVIE